jgi:hypothetical protein
MKSEREATVEEAIAQLDLVREEWLGRSGVNGIDVGLLWDGATMSDRVGIRVKVEKLLDRAEVPEGELFPRHIGGIRVQIREEPAPGLQSLE